MKSILLLVLAVNFGFFFIASEGDSGGQVRLPITDTNVSLLCFAGDKPSANCNLSGIDKPAKSPKNNNRKVSANIRTVASRPAKRVITRSTAKSMSMRASRKPQQVASLGNPSINTRITTPINSTPFASSINTASKKGKVQCYTMGPFIDKADAFSLNSQLVALKVQSVIRTLKEKEQFWVYLQDNRATKRIASVLRSKGFTSFKIVSRKGQRDVVSLGWFNNHSSATKKYKKLASLGFTPKLVVKGSPGEQVWVDYLLPSGKRLSRSARKAIKQAKNESWFRIQRCK